MLVQDQLPAYYGDKTMTDLITTKNNLPTTLEDLSAFVLFNDEKVKAVRAALSAMHKLKAPRDVLDLKLREAQELSERWQKLNSANVSANCRKIAAATEKAKILKSKTTVLSILKNRSRNRRQSLNWA